MLLRPWYAHESPRDLLKWRLAFSWFRVGPETLHFWQAPGDSSVAGLGTQYVFWGPRVRVAGTVIIQPPLWSTPYLYTLILKGLWWAWSHRIGLRLLKGSSQNCFSSTWDDLHWGTAWPHRSPRESTLLCLGSHPNGLSAWGRTSALLACSKYLSFWKITVWYSGEKNRLSGL